MADDSAASINIGEKIRKLRKENDISIQKLAKRAGLSPAGIYKIETNDMTPTITTLLKIANALDKRISYFLSDGDVIPDVEFIKKGERKKAYISQSGTTIENIAARLEDCMIEAAQLVVDVGGHSGEEPMSHKGEELVFCLQGTMEFTIRDEVYLLHPGDSLHFKSSLPHSWKNIGQGKGIILSVLTPPPFR